MSNKTVKYLLGVDGGGTKTEFLLCDLNEKEIRRLFLGGSNSVNRGIENTCAVLGEGIAQVCDGFDFGEISVFAGVAGSKSGESQRLINEFLSRLGFASFGCGSDIDLALEAALKGEDGTAVIMGTGIVAYSRSGERLHRAGGRGYMIDKGGSGFHFGSDTLNSAFEFLDGRGGSETIFRLVEKKLGKRIEEAVTDIYSGGTAFVASFAPVVFEAFNLGDREAFEIIDRNACEAAKVINGVRRVLNNCGKKIVICGGLCKQRDILEPFLQKYIDGEASLEFLNEPMVNGAVSLAKGRDNIC